MLAAGRSISGIAGELGLARNTVAPVRPRRRPEELLVHDGTGRRPSILDGYEP
jgi:hypothetical protein